MRDWITRLRRKVAPVLPNRPDPGDRRDARRLLESGRQAYNRRDYREAETRFRKAVLTDESEAMAHYFLGLALYKQDRTEDAVRAWTRAEEVDPESEMAEKARRKIGYVRKQMERVVRELEGNLRKR